MTLGIIPLTGRLLSLSWPGTGKVEESPPFRGLSSTSEGYRRSRDTDLSSLVLPRIVYPFAGL